MLVIVALILSNMGRIDKSTDRTDSLLPLRSVVGDEHTYVGVLVSFL